MNLKKHILLDLEQLENEIQTPYAASSYFSKSIM